MKKKVILFCVMIAIFLGAILTYNIVNAEEAIWGNYFEPNEMKENDRPYMGYAIGNPRNK